MLFGLEISMVARIDNPGETTVFGVVGYVFMVIGAIIVLAGSNK